MLGKSANPAEIRSKRGRASSKVKNLHRGFEDRLKFFGAISAEYPLFSYPSNRAMTASLQTSRLLTPIMGIDHSVNNLDDTSWTLRD